MTPFDSNKTDCHIKYTLQSPKINLSESALLPNTRFN